MVKKVKKYFFKWYLGFWRCYLPRDAKCFIYDKTLSKWFKCTILITCVNGKWVDVVTSGGDILIVKISKVYPCKINRSKGF